MTTLNEFALSRKDFCGEIVYNYPQTVSHFGIMYYFYLVYGDDAFQNYREHWITEISAAIKNASAHKVKNGNDRKTRESSFNQMVNTDESLTLSKTYEYIKTKFDEEIKKSIDDRIKNSKFNVNIGEEAAQHARYFYTNVVKSIIVNGITETNVINSAIKEYLHKNGIYEGKELPFDKIKNKEDLDKVKNVKCLMERIENIKL